MTEETPDFEAAAFFSSHVDIHPCSECPDEVNNLARAYLAQAARIEKLEGLSILFELLRAYPRCFADVLARACR